MSESADRKPAGRNLSIARRVALLLIVPAIIVALDQASKAYAEANWNREPVVVHEYLGGIFQTTYARNYGAFLSLLEGAPEVVRFWVLVVGNAVALTGIWVYVLMSRTLTLSVLTPIVLLLGGGIGNLIDRLRFGYVIDYFYLTLGGPFHTGVFNVADMAITAAFPILMWLAFRGERVQQPNAITAQCPTAAA